jgi:hypothetical protein
MPKIATEFWMKPIPPRQFDWSAWYDGDEPNDAGCMRIGYGRTREEAAHDLLTNHPAPCVDCRGKGSAIPGIECATCEGTGERCAFDPLDPIEFVS